MAIRNGRSIKNSASVTWKSSQAHLRPITGSNYSIAAWRREVKKVIMTPLLESWFPVPGINDHRDDSWHTFYRAGPDYTQCSYSSERDFKILGAGLFPLLGFHWASRPWNPTMK